MGICWLSYCEGKMRKLFYPDYMEKMDVFNPNGGYWEVMQQGNQFYAKKNQTMNEFLNNMSDSPFQDPPNRNEKSKMNFEEKSPPKEPFNDISCILQNQNNQDNSFFFN